MPDFKGLVNRDRGQGMLPRVLRLCLQVLTSLPLLMIGPALLYMFWPWVALPSCRVLYGGIGQISEFLACHAERRVHLFGGQFAVVISVLIGRLAIWVLKSTAPATVSTTAEPGLSKPKDSDGPKTKATTPE